MNSRDGLARAVAYFGSDERLAAAIGFSPVAVERARQRGRTTYLMAIEIEAATHGEVRRESLLAPSVRRVRSRFALRVDRAQ